jgi:hypothetical protein
MSQLEINKAFINHEENLLKYLIDAKLLNDKQCYMVVAFGGIKYFENKINLEEYLISLTPKFEYFVLSELALHLIDKKYIVDVSITKKQ